MSEKEYALMEGHMNAAESEYFAARPHLHSRDSLRTFEAGFKWAWNTSQAQVTELLRRERGRCAKVVDEHVDQLMDAGQYMPASLIEQAAKAIRALPDEVKP